MNYILEKIMLANKIAEKRGGDSLKKAGDKIGVDAATVMRMEKGVKLEEIKLSTFFKTCSWLEIAPDHFIKTEEEPIN